MNEGALFATPLDAIIDDTLKPDHDSPVMPPASQPHYMMKTSACSNHTRARQGAILDAKDRSANRIVLPHAHRAAFNYFNKETLVDPGRMSEEKDIAKKMSSFGAYPKQHEDTSKGFSVSNTGIFFRNYSPPYLYRHAFTVTNTATTARRFKIVPPDGPFSVSALSAELKPGLSRTIEVFFRPPTREDYSGTIEITAVDFSCSVFITAQNERANFELVRVLLDGNEFTAATFFSEQVGPDHTFLDINMDALLKRYDERHVFRLYLQNMDSVPYDDYIATHKDLKQTESVYKLQPKTTCLHTSSHVNIIDISNSEGECKMDLFLNRDSSTGCFFSDSSVERTHRGEPLSLADTMDTSPRSAKKIHTKQMIVNQLAASVNLQDLDGKSALREFPLTQPAQKASGSADRCICEVGPGGVICLELVFGDNLLAQDSHIIHLETEEMVVLDILLRGSVIAGYIDLTRVNQKPLATPLSRVLDIEDFLEHAADYTLAPEHIFVSNVDCHVGGSMEITYDLGLSGIDDKNVILVPRAFSPSLTLGQLYHDRYRQTSLAALMASFLESDYDEGIFNTNGTERLSHLPLVPMPERPPEEVPNETQRSIMTFLRAEKRSSNAGECRESSTENTTEKAAAAISIPTASLTAMAPMMPIVSKRLQAVESANRGKPRIAYYQRRLTVRLTMPEARHTPARYVLDVCYGTSQVTMPLIRIVCKATPIYRSRAVTLLTETHAAEKYILDTLYLKEKQTDYLFISVPSLDLGLVPVSQGANFSFTVKNCSKTCYFPFIVSTNLKSASVSVTSHPHSHGVQFLVKRFRENETLENRRNIIFPDVLSMLDVRKRSLCYEASRSGNFSGCLQELMTGEANEPRNDSESNLNSPTMAAAPPAHAFRRRLIGPQVTSAGRPLPTSRRASLSPCHASPSATSFDTACTAGTTGTAGSGADADAAGADQAAKPAHSDDPSNIDDILCVYPSCGILPPQTEVTIMVQLVPINVGPIEAFIVINTPSSKYYSRAIRRIQHKMRELELRLTSIQAVFDPRIVANQFADTCGKTIPSMELQRYLEEKSNIFTSTAQSARSGTSRVPHAPGGFGVPGGASRLPGLPGLSGPRGSANTAAISRLEALAPQPLETPMTRDSAKINMKNLALYNDRDVCCRVYGVVGAPSVNILDRVIKPTHDTLSTVKMRIENTGLTGTTFTLAVIKGDATIVQPITDEMRAALLGEYERTAKRGPKKAVFHSLLGPGAQGRLLKTSIDVSIPAGEVVAVEVAPGSDADSLIVARKHKSAFGAMVMTIDRNSIDLEDNVILSAAVVKNRVEPPKPFMYFSSDPERSYIILAPATRRIPTMYLSSKPYRPIKVGFCIVNPSPVQFVCEIAVGIDAVAPSLIKIPPKCRAAASFVLNPNHSGVLETFINIHDRNMRVVLNAIGPDLVITSPYIRNYQYLVDYQGMNSDFTQAMQGGSGAGTSIAKAALSPVQPSRDGKWGARASPLTHDRRDKANCLTGEASISPGTFVHPERAGMLEQHTGKPVKTTFWEEYMTTIPTDVCIEHLSEAELTKIVFEQTENVSEQSMTGIHGQTLDTLTLQHSHHLTLGSAAANDADQSSQGPEEGRAPLKFSELFSSAIRFETIRTQLPSLVFEKSTGPSPTRLSLRIFNPTSGTVVITPVVYVTPTEMVRLKHSIGSDGYVSLTGEGLLCQGPTVGSEVRQYSIDAGEDGDAGDGNISTFESLDANAGNSRSTSMRFSSVTPKSTSQFDDMSSPRYQLGNTGTPRFMQHETDLARSASVVSGDLMSSQTQHGVAVEASDRIRNASLPQNENAFPTPRPVVPDIPLPLTSSSFFVTPAQVSIPSQKSAIVYVECKPLASETAIEGILYINGLFILLRNERVPPRVSLCDNVSLLSLTGSYNKDMSFPLYITNSSLDTRLRVRVSIDQPFAVDTSAAQPQCFLGPQQKFSFTAKLSWRDALSGTGQLAALSATLSAKQPKKLAPVITTEVSGVPFANKERTRQDLTPLSAEGNGDPILARTIFDVLSEERKSMTLEGALHFEFPDSLDGEGCPLVQSFPIVCTIESPRLLPELITITFKPAFVSGHALEYLTVTNPTNSCAAWRILHVPLADAISASSQVDSALPTILNLDAIKGMHCTVTSNVTMKTAKMEAILRSVSTTIQKSDYGSAFYNSVHDTLVVDDPSVFSFERSSGAVEGHDNVRPHKSDTFAVRFTPGSSHMKCATSTTYDSVMPLQFYSTFYVHVEHGAGAWVVLNATVTEDSLRI